MNINDITLFRDSTAADINAGRLHHAFRAMRTFSEGNMTWEITSDIDAVEQHYSYMLRFMADGVDDPNRQAVYADICSKARGIVDVLTRRAMMKENTSLYYGVARLCEARRGETIDSILHQYTEELRRLSTDFDSFGNPKRTVNAETLLRNIFRRIWTTYPLSVSDLAAITDSLSDAALPSPTKICIIGALSLGAMEFYDPKRLELLLSVYLNNADERAAVTALLGFFIALFRFRKRPMPRQLRLILDSAKEAPLWNEDFKTAAIELMRARDTERVSEKLRNDILPSIAKAGAKMSAQLSKADHDLESFTEGINPEWEEFLHNSGLEDKLKAMTEMQAEGSDVYMSSFSSLKNFPFFEDIANWFLPFYPTYSDVAAADDDAGTTSDMLRKMPILCDNDKFSVMFAFSMAPAHLRENIARTIEAQMQQNYEELSEFEKASEFTHRKAMITNTVRNLYRFFNLFRRKEEFFNPFDKQINLMTLESLTDGYCDLEMLSVIAEFDLKHFFYDEAVVLFKKIDREDAPDAMRSQKIGFCLEKLHLYAEAASYYEEASLLSDPQPWLLSRLAGVFRRLGKPRKAIDTLQQLLLIDPDNFNAIVALGNALIEAHKPEEAEAQFHKALYLDENNIQSRRGLAWAQFLNHKFKEAAENYETLVVEETDAATQYDDFINAGHTARALGQIRQAIDYYRRAINCTDARFARPDIAQFEARLTQDIPDLNDAGIDTSLNKLIIETILYSFDNH